MTPSPNRCDIETVIKKVQHDLQHASASLDLLLRDAWPNDLKAPWPALLDLADSASMLSLSFRAMHNRGAAINRLPAELLGEIFYQMQDPFNHSWSLDRSRPLEQEAFYITQWRSVCDVCRLWRDVACHLPKLWQQIIVARDSFHLRQSDLVSLSTRYSGQLPLSILVEKHIAKPSIWESPLMAGILAQMPRVRDLQLVDISPRALLSLVKLNALGLETLVVAHPKGLGYSNSPLFNKWQTPRLRSLMAIRYAGWKTGNFGKLRHLLLEDQVFDLEGFRKLLAVLATSPLLKDVVFCDVFLDVPASDGIGRFLAQQLAPIIMPKLKRLCLSYVTSNTLSGRESRLLDLGCASITAELLSSKLVVREKCAQQVLFPWNAFLPPLEGLTRPGNYVQKLQISHCVVAGITSRSGFVVEGKFPDHFLQESVLVEHLEELYVTAETLKDDEPVDDAQARWRPVLRKMYSLTKLSLAPSGLKNIGSWLDMLSHDDLPALAELHLHSQTHADCDSITRFIKSRDQRGRRLRELHFFKSDYMTRGSKESCRRCSGSFAQLRRHVEKINFIDNESSCARWKAFDAEIAAVFERQADHSPARAIWCKELGARA